MSARPAALRSLALVVAVLVLWGANCQPPAPAPTGPAVTAIDPANGTERVATSSAVRIDFDSGVDLSSLTPAAASVAAPAGPVPGAWRLENAGRRAVFQSTSPLPASDTIRVSLTTSVRGANGAPLVSAFASAFRTAGPSRLRAGAAAVDVTPPVGVPLAGYGGGKRRLFPPDFNPNNYHQFMSPSTGVRDPLVAKALVLDDGTDRIAFLKLDLVAVEEEAVKDIAARILATTGIREENIFVSGTHTHSGPGTLTNTIIWQVITMDSFQPRIYEGLIAGAARAIELANANLADARLGIGQTQVQGVQRNRRDHPGRFDPTLSVLRVDRADGQPIAVLFNIAIHAICLSQDSMLISADWPGYAESTIETALPGAVALFVNAAEGDVTPGMKGDAGVQFIGGTVAQAALATRAQTPVRSSVDLAAGVERITFPKAWLYYSCNQPQNAAQSQGFPVDFCLVYRTIFGNELTVKQEITPIVPSSFPMKALKIDDTAIVCFPGEPITRLGQMAQAQAYAAGFRTAIVFGLTGGHVAYITTPEEFDEGGYEALATFYGRDEGTKMVESLGRVLQRIR
ncbi:MAG: neutral/alkaline non-lysosomal ceramidase N-terminal domain-containing protein [Planctomycetes bacterium]|nr:neutral/alkaline non-lysosomal ceramidase N-terminal domain-containing protein [Planctomycetota bacterium]